MSLTRKKCRVKRGGRRLDLNAYVDKAEVGRRLRDIRKYRSQREIADALDVSDTAVGNYERGEITPPDEIKVKYADMAGKTVQEIFFSTDAT